MQVRQTTFLSQYDVIATTKDLLSMKIISVFLLLCNQVKGAIGLKLAVLLQKLMRSQDLLSANATISQTLLFWW